MSVGPYWWPNPAKPDGLPYIRRDGEVNPERFLYDNVPLNNLDSTATTLSLAYYFSGEKKYADRAAQLIRVWFIEDSTRMNPNLKYGQAIKGKVDGRGIGIIDTRGFGRIVEAIELIRQSPDWSIQDQEEMVSWFGKYLKWLLESEYGIDERDHKNNHGTYYDLLVISLAVFVGQNELVEEVLNKVAQDRIEVQIDPDGKQPYEISRTRAYTYSVMNLTGLFYLALIAEKRGIDLWSYQSPDSRSLKKALMYLLPFAKKEKKWPYQMLKGWEDNIQNLAFLLRIAATKYNEPKFEEMIDELPDVDKKSLRLKLLFPEKL
jgi:hypothetical protein